MTDIAPEKNLEEMETVDSFWRASNGHRRLFSTSILDPGGKEGIIILNDFFQKAAAIDQIEEEQQQIKFQSQQALLFIT